MRYVSLFSGVEAATVAWDRLGWEPVAFAEVDEFPSAVLAHRFPDVPNLGDVTKVDWKEFHGRYGAVDVLCGGSPCQSFSVAGSRTGLKGESGLMFEYIRAVRELVRASGGVGPRYIIWENVPGALNSERGNAFGQLLAELDDIGYGLAWRVLDAQFVRVPDGPRLGFTGPVPQRRRRVFLVGSLGSPHAAEILFERESLRGDHPKGREAREALAGDAYERVATGDGQVISMQSDGSSSNGNQNGCGYNMEGSAYTVNGRDRQSVCMQGNMIGRKFENGPQGCGYDEDVSFTLNTIDRHAVCMSTGQANAEVTEGISPTLNTAHEQPIVCAADDNGKTALEEDMCGSLKVGGGCSVASNGDEVISALCARDWKGVGSQYVSDGKVICQRNA